MIPKFSMTFLCAGTADAVRRGILETISDKPIRIQLPNDSNKGTKELVLLTSPKYYFIRNSYMPVVYIEMQEKENTEVFVRFELHRGVKSFFVFWSVALLLVPAIWLVCFLLGQVAFTPIVFMPFIMILFGYALSVVCLYGSSRYVSRVLFKELPYRQGKLPKLQWQK